MPSPVTALIVIDVQEALFQPEPRRFETRRDKARVRRGPCRP